MKQFELNAEFDKNNYELSKSQLFPNLYLGADQNFSMGRTVDPYTNEFSEENVSSNRLGVSSSVILFDGLKTYNSIKQNTFNLMASLQNVEKAKNDISLNVVTAYLQILFRNIWLISRQLIINISLKMEIQKSLR